MSLVIANLVDIVKKQYLFKLKANIDSFSSLIWIQLLALLFSLGGVGSTLASSGYLSIEVKYYSADLVIAFTMIWAFVTAIIITTKPYRNQDFTYVTNRLSSSLANIIFLLTASIIGGITAMLVNNLLKIIAYFIFNEQLYSFQSGFRELALGISMTILYVFCISAFGYLVGTLVQVSKLFILFVPVLFFGTILLKTSVQKEPFLTSIFKFYFFEPSLLLLLLKILLTSCLFFFTSIAILNRMEVRR
ncbi:hypothetical protein [Cytobacillus solani]|uniref:Uncharacterized protein n=1 Tax=Cytobacillus solani TaxID=1637975 RepID=A0A0Q3T232_9BACI|nr:hypothetical protein [Cytobacillus solani]KQL17557.1 hypothetical protein AN957_02230 [Cytobacillus solani]